MKKKLVTFVTMIILCVTFAIGLVGCKKTDEPPKDAAGRVNWLTTVLEPYYIKAEYEWEEDENRFACHYLPSENVNPYLFKVEYLEDVTVEDLIGETLPYNNYGSFTFRWKTEGYRITKVEFDFEALDSFKSILTLYNHVSRAEQEVDLAPMVSQHVVFECDINYNSYIFGISPGTNHDLEMAFVKYKISNLVVTAEKISEKK